MEENEKIHAHAFTTLPLLGPIRLRRIAKHFGSFARAWRETSLTELTRAGLEPHVSPTVLAAKRAIDPARLYARFARQEIICLADDEPAYPKLLREIYAPPVLLYVRGAWVGGDELTLAVVGTRKFTSYGELAVQRIVGELADSGLTIVSGLAMGIDALSHQAALDRGGRTIAVLGSGVDEIFPRTNYRLAQKIMTRGALVSEYPPGTPPLKQNFPVRNRLISGLSRGTLVIEAGASSGALITACQALEQNREVLAVPGAINADKSAGTNMLISKGATLVQRAQDVLDALDLKQPKQIQEARKVLPGSRTEAAIYQVLSNQPVLLDQLINLTRFDVNVISSTLSIMEIKGLVKNIGGNRYIKC